MLVIKCDGNRYVDGVKCDREYEVDDVKDSVPHGWIMIEGSIVNKNNDAHLLLSNGTRHYCSKSCLEFSLFKNVPIKE